MLQILVTSLGFTRFTFKDEVCLSGHNTASPYFSCTWTVDTDRMSTVNKFHGVQLKRVTGINTKVRKGFGWMASEWCRVRWQRACPVGSWTNLIEAMLRGGLWASSYWGQKKSTSQTPVKFTNLINNTKLRPIKPRLTPDFQTMCVFLEDIVSSLVSTQMYSDKQSNHPRVASPKHEHSVLG